MGDRLVHTGMRARGVDRVRVPRPRARFLLWLSFAGVLLGLVVGELLVRLAGPLLPGQFTSRALQEPHPVYGVSHRPGASAWLRDPEFTAFVRFNSDGLRGPELATRPPGTARRVLILGDSFVEGAEVDEAETFPARLAGHLADGGAPAEVLNAGVRGWGTAQEYLYLTRRGARLRPDVVILVVYVGNDLVDNSPELSRPAPDGSSARPYFTLEGDGLALTPPRPSTPSTLAPLLGMLRTHLALTNLVESGVVAKVGAADQEESLRSVSRLVFASPPPQEWARSWAVTEALLAASRDAAREQGARFILVAAPHKAQLDHGEWGRLIRGVSIEPRRWDRSLPQRRLAEFATREGIELLDLMPALDAAEGATPLYFARNSHWTQAGHAIVAQTIARHMDVESRGQNADRSGRP